MSYIAPLFERKAFNCPHCGVLAQFHWAKAHHEVAFHGIVAAKQPTEVFVAYCQHCQGKTLWLQEKGPGKGTGKLVYPSVSTAPLSHPDTPNDIAIDFEEARGIVSVSPRGAAALLRLAVQKLCKHLGERGENINTDIAALVQKGLPVRVQQALDIVRVTGNNAVHPGALDLKDDTEIAQRLFVLVNLIVENRISEPKQIEALYQALPQPSLDAIRRRDG